MAQATKANDKNKPDATAGAVGFRLREAALILALALAAYLLLSLLTYEPTDPGWSTTGTDDLIANRGGIVGAWLADALLYGFGFPAYLAPFMVGFSGWLLFSWGKRADGDDALHFWVLKSVGLVMALAAASGLSSLSLMDYADLLPLGAGGVLGEVVGHGFESVFGASGTSLLLLALLLTGVTLFTGLSWLMVIDRLGAMAMVVLIHVARWSRELKENLQVRRTRQQREETFIAQKEKMQHKAKVRVEPKLQVQEPSKREEKERQQPLFETPDAIKPIPLLRFETAQAHLDSLTKPPGSLGLLEDLAKKYVAIRDTDHPSVNRKSVVVFAADHGVTEEGISAYPAKVTSQMVQNFLDGGAAVNVLARQQNAEVLVVDIGVNHKFAPHPKLLDKKISFGTRNLAKEPAMTRAEAEESLTIGIQIAAQLADKGIDLLATGEMGIGNTTASSAIFSVLSGLPANKVTGRGTGIDDKTLEKRYL